MHINFYYLKMQLDEERLTNDATPFLHTISFDDDNNTFFFKYTPHHTNELEN